jgi:hypothetical protein
MDAHRDEMRARYHTESAQAIYTSLKANGLQGSLHAVRAWFGQWADTPTVIEEKKRQAGRDGGKKGHGRRRLFRFNNPKQQQRWAAELPDLSYLLHRQMKDLSASEVEAFEQRAREIFTQELGRERVATSHEG